MHYCWEQVDIEMSFISALDIQNVIEMLLQRVIYEATGQSVALPFMRLSYDEAMSRFEKK